MDAQDTVIGYYSKAIIDHWKERGFEIDPYEPGQIVNGLPKGVKRVTPRSGNVRLPNYIALGDVEVTTPNIHRAVRERVRRKAERYAADLVESERESLRQIERDLNEILEAIRADVDKIKNARLNRASFIIKQMAMMYGFTKEDILGRARNSPVCKARHHVYAVLRSELGLSYPQIGSIMDRDQTTIINGIQRHEERSKAAEQILQEAA